MKKGEETGNGFDYAQPNACIHSSIQFTEQVVVELFYITLQIIFFFHPRCTRIALVHIQSNAYSTGVDFQQTNTTTLPVMLHLRRRLCLPT